MSATITKIMPGVDLQLAKLEILYHEVACGEVSQKDCAIEAIKSTILLVKLLDDMPLMSKAQILDRIEKSERFISIIKKIIERGST